jgi:hypothetical protein
MLWGILNHTTMSTMYFVAVAPSHFFIGLASTHFVNLSTATNYRGNFTACAIRDGLGEGWNCAAKDLRSEDEEDDITRFNPSLWR